MAILQISLGQLIPSVFVQKRTFGFGDKWQKFSEANPSNSVEALPYNNTTAEKCTTSTPDNLTHTEIGKSKSN